MRIEGYTTDEILGLSDGEVEAFVFTDAPLVLRAGSAQVLGQFRLGPGRLTVELAQIDGGGEGVLPALWVLAERLARRRVLAERLARRRGLSEVEWIVHAIHCAHPNLKLRRVLERRGFIVQHVAGGVEAFYQLHRLPEETGRVTDD